MRVLDCDCGRTLQAANDDDLTLAVQSHVATDHPDMDLSEEQARALVDARAYDAADA